MRLRRTATAAFGSTCRSTCGAGSTTGYTAFRGTFTYEAAAGLVMFARNLTTAAASHFVAFNVSR
ncbi:hypothetical protein EDD27_3186 [Nonomuraea polychroma]|uniref:Uncharacterized protein n=1 Tax=Nonomuraea polychroma TaxID=46176 RepID=A0A438M5T3_9ACTN|nr:hypothetical protein EDD27_3186 [Nonomuraea polychroma]